MTEGEPVGSQGEKVIISPDDRVDQGRAEPSQPVMVRQVILTMKLLLVGVPINPTLVLVKDDMWRLRYM